MGNFLNQFCDCLGKSSAVIVQVETGKTQTTPQNITQDITNIIQATTDTIQTVQEFKKEPIAELNNLAKE